MSYDNSEPSAPTDGTSKKNRKPANRLGVVNTLPILAFRVRQADGTLTKFDVLKIAHSLESAMLAIGRDLNRQNQYLVYDLCSQVLNTMVQDMPVNGVIDIEDINVQVEMTLMLNRQVDLAKALLKL